ncbi:plasmid replication initiator TrfA [Halomonas sp. AOP43-A1-21]
MDAAQRLGELQKQQEIESLAALGTQQMDFWPDGKRAAPNAMVRCALFKGAMGGKAGSRLIHQQTLIASLGGEEIYYNGEDLDQRDFDVWMAVLQVFREQPIGATVEVSSNELLRLAGLPNSGQSHKALKERLQRLAFTRVDVLPTKPGSKAIFFGALLQEAERMASGELWKLRLAPKLKALFGDGYTWVDWEIRNELGRASLAQWLHSFYRSHREPLPIGVATLYELCGSNTKELRFFRNDLKKALRRLAEVCERHGVDLEWDYVPGNDTIRVKWITKETQKRPKRLK